MEAIVVLTRDFFLENVYWMAGLAALALVGIFFVVDHFMSVRQLKKEKAMRDGKVYLEALGGEGNVIGKSLEGSRIIVSLKDYELVNKDKLRDYGVSGFVKMSDHLVMVVKKDPDGVYNKLFGSRP
jgi:phosphotransferase system IIB component